MLTVNFQSRTPVYQQLYDDVVRLASLGVLKSNTKLPPVRVLATELGINPNTVSKAYKMLEADGSPFTAHTTNPVPLIVVGYDCKLKEGGVLADLCPTMLEIMELPQPKEMTGKSLIEK